MCMNMHCSRECVVLLVFSPDNAAPLLSAHDVSLVPILCQIDSLIAAKLNLVR